VSMACLWAWPDVAEGNPDVMSSLTGNLVRFPAFGGMMSSGNP